MTVAATGQRTVLVIEDDPWTRTITTALLAGEGFAVVEAKNGEPFAADLRETIFNSRAEQMPIGQIGQSVV